MSQQHKHNFNEAVFGSHWLRCECGAKYNPFTNEFYDPNETKQRIESHYKKGMGGKA